MRQKIGYRAAVVVNQQQATARPAVGQLGTVFEWFDMDGTSSEAMRYGGAAPKIAVDKKYIIDAVADAHSINPPLPKNSTSAWATAS